MRWLLGVMLVLSACGSVAPPAPTPTTTRPTISQEEQIRDVHRTFVRAWNAKDSVTALPLLSRRSIEYVEELRGHALHSTEEQLATRQFGDRLKVYELRASPRADIVRGGSGYDLLKLVVELESDRLDEDELTGLEIRDTSASDGTWAFYHESGEWKVSLAEVERAIGASFQREAAKNGVVLDDHIFGVLMSQYGEARAIELMKPMN